MPAAAAPAAAAVPFRKERKKPRRESESFIGCSWVWSAMRDVTIILFPLGSREQQTRREAGIPAERAGRHAGRRVMTETCRPDHSGSSLLTPVSRAGDITGEARVSFGLDRAHRCSSLEEKSLCRSDQDLLLVTFT